MSRRTEIKELIKKGYSLAEIARLWGISRQRVHQLLAPDNIKEIKSRLRQQRSESMVQSP